MSLFGSTCDVTRLQIAYDSLEVSRQNPNYSMALAVSFQNLHVHFFGEVFVVIIRFKEKVHLFICNNRQHVRSVSHTHYICCCRFKPHCLLVLVDCCMPATIR